MGTAHFPASIGQRLVWFLEHYRSETSSVNCPATFRISGKLSGDLLRGALADLARRHEALRTTLSRDGRNLLQHVHEDGVVRPALSVVDVSGGEEEMLALLRAEQAADLEPGREPVRTSWWRLGREDHVVCVNMHHLVSDAWSCGVVIADLIALLGGRRPAAPSWQYSDFTTWQAEQEKSGKLRAHQDFWCEQLDGMKLAPLPWLAPEGSPRPSPGLETLSLSAETAAGLREFSQRRRHTLFSVLLALYYLLLNHETGQDDLAVASFFANRTRREVTSTVGFFANMLVLRAKVEPDRPFADLLAATRRTVLDATTHQAVPCQMLPMSRLQRTPGRVNEVVFQMLPDRKPGSWSPIDAGGGLRIDTFRPDHGLSRFGLNLTVIPREDRFDVRLSYDRNQLDREWVRGLLRSYRVLAEGMLAAPDAPAAKLTAALR
ncbi:condensation domain-containing protein [Amycolatopsis sp. NPDC059090]|uniref:condensation domain-containing protein n=1 Tax=unclassified Amycolatopsis TaxID=2618356 RepID=UPI00366B80D8